jgi:hypothetical protein
MFVGFWEFDLWERGAGNQVVVWGKRESSEREYKQREDIDLISSESLNDWQLNSIENMSCICTVN